MTDQRDPALQALFADAEQDLADEAFINQIMDQTDRLKKRVTLALICIGGALAGCVWLLATPLQKFAQLLTQALSVPLLTIDNSLFAVLLSPLNNVGSVSLLGVTVLTVAYRKIFLQK